QASLLDQALRFREVALGFVERSLAVHHASAGLLAEALDVVLCVRHHSSSFFSTAASASSAGSSYRCPPMGYSSSSSGLYTRAVALPPPRCARGADRPRRWRSAVGAARVHPKSSDRDA